MLRLIILPLVMLISCERGTFSIRNGRMASNPPPTSWLDAIESVLPLKTGSAATGSYISSVENGGIAHGDVNGDGRVDIVVMDPVAGELVVLFNNGISFDRKVTATVIPSVAKHLTLGDINNDGILDLMITHFAVASRVEFFHGDGTGLFISQGTFVVPNYAYKLEASDLNKDGYADLVVHLYTGTPGSSNGIAIYHNDQAGGFTQAIYQTVSSYVRYHVIADFDNDTHLDVAFSSWAANSIYVLYSNGNGTYTSYNQTTSTGSAWLRGITALDMNGDGKLDIASTMYGQDKIALFRNDAPVRSFTEMPFVDKAGMAIMPQVKSMDIDNDGKEDLIVTAYSKFYPVILYGNGNFTFQDPIDLNYAQQSHDSVYLFDYNGDGFKDLYITSYETKQNSINVLINNQQGSFLPLVGSFGKSDIDDPTKSGKDMEVVDLNNDLKPDVVFKTRTSELLIKLATDSGLETAPSSVLNVSGLTSHRLADVNGDGFVDIVGVEYSGSRTRTFLNNQSGGFSVSIDGLIGFQPYDLEVLDVNNDTIPDLVVTELGQTRFNTLLGDGAGNFNSSSSIATTDRPLFIKKMNLNGNNFEDIVLVMADGSNDPIHILPFINNGDRTFTALSQIHDDKYSRFNPVPRENKFDDLHILSTDGKFYFYENDGVSGDLSTNSILANLFLNYIDYSVLVDGAKTYLIFQSFLMSGSSLYEFDKSLNTLTHLNHPSVGCGLDSELIDLDGDGKKELVSIDGCSADPAANYVVFKAP